MDTVTLSEAKEHLENLIARARRGEVITIDDGLGPVRLTASRVAGGVEERVTDTMPKFVPLAKPRVPGQLKGKMQVPERLMEPMTEEELRDWYGDDA